MTNRLLTAVGAVLAHFEHHDFSNPSASIQAHLPAPEMQELKDAYVEATADAVPTPEPTPDATADAVPTPDAPTDDTDPAIA